MNHLGDTNKMVSETPRTDDSWKTTHTMYELAGEMKRIERELNAANQRIRLLISERDTAQAYADQKWKLRREFHDLFGTDDVEQGMAVVREMKDRIKRLEDALSRIANQDYRGNRSTESQMAEEALKP